MNNFWLKSLCRYRFWRENMKISSEQLFRWKNEHKSLKKTLWPLFMDGFQLPQGYSHFEEAVYFLQFSSQKFLVLILLSSEGWKEHLPFPHPGISLMTKDLSQIKVYTYFNIGDAKTLIKLKRKIRLNSPGVVPYTHLF